MKPGVQNPHCSAACSRNFCCTGCSLSPWAMPSTVVMPRPSASAPSIRHEQTILPSQMTVQAPQSPELQPSLLPVRLSSSRSTSSKVCCGSQRNSTGSPLMMVDTWVLAMGGLLALSGAFKGDRGRASCQDAGDLDPVFDRAALVVDRLAGATGGGIELREGVIIEPVPDQRFLRLFRDDLRRRYRPEHNAGVGAHTVPIERDIDPTADDGDVHFRPRNKAQIGVRLMWLWFWHMKLDDELALLERGLSWPCDDRLDRRLAPTVGAGDDRGRARCDQRRHAVGSRRGVAQIAGERGASLDLLRADQIHAL